MRQHRLNGFAGAPGADLLPVSLGIQRGQVETGLLVVAGEELHGGLSGVLTGARPAQVGLRVLDLQAVAQGKQDAVVAGSFAQTSGEIEHGKAHRVDGIAGAIAEGKAAEEKLPARPARELNANAEGDIAVALYDNLRSLRGPPCLHRGGGAQIQRERVLTGPEELDLVEALPALGRQPLTARLPILQREDGAGITADPHLQPRRAGHQGLLGIHAPGPSHREEEQGKQDAGTVTGAKMSALREGLMRLLGWHFSAIAPC